MSMEGRELPELVQARFSLAWTAYLKPFFLMAILLGIGAVSMHQGWPKTGLAIAVVAVPLFVYRVMLIRSVVLYIDAHGVWVFSGILPWSRGINGVKWRDLEDAVYFTGFFAWMFKSYSIRVGHRFTRNSEIALKHVYRGDMAVEHINMAHKHMLAGGEVEVQE